MLYRRRAYFVAAVSRARPHSDHRLVLKGTSTEFQVISERCLAIRRCDGKEQIAKKGLMTWYTRCDGFRGRGARNNGLSTGRGTETTQDQSSAPASWLWQQCLLYGRIGVEANILGPIDLSPRAQACSSNMAQASTEFLDFLAYRPIHSPSTNPNPNF